MMGVRPAYYPLLGLFMLLVPVADGTVLAPFYPLWVLPLVLISKEVAAFALGALEYDFVSWHLVMSGRSGR